MSPIDPNSPESRRRFMTQSLRRLVRFGASMQETVKELTPKISLDGPLPRIPDRPAPKIPAPAPPPTQWLNSQYGMSYIKLGKTPLMASRIALGGAGIRKANASLVMKALEKGVNLIETAPNYGESQTVLGGMMRQIGGRAWIVSGMAPYEPQGRDGRTPEQEFVEIFWDSLESSLARLEVDHIDCFYIQAVSEPWVLRNPALQEALQIAREQGKIRYTGFSTHRNAAAVIDAGLETASYDVILAPLDPLNRSTMGPILDRLREREIGFVGIDPAAGIADLGHDPFEIRELPANLTPAQLALLYTLKNSPLVSCLAHVETEEELEHHLRMTALDPSVNGWNEVDGLIEEVLWPVCSLCGERRAFPGEALEALHDLHYGQRDFWLHGGSPGDLKKAEELLAVCGECGSTARPAEAADDAG